MRDCEKYVSQLNSKWDEGEKFKSKKERITSRKKSFDIEILQKQQQREACKKKKTQSAREWRGNMEWI